MGSCLRSLSVCSNACPTGIPSLRWRAVVAARGQKAVESQPARAEVNLNRLASKCDRRGTSSGTRLSLCVLGCLAGATTHAARFPNRSQKLVSMVSRRSRRSAAMLRVAGFAGLAPSSARARADESPPATHRVATSVRAERRSCRRCRLCRTQTRPAWLLLTGEAVPARISRPSTRAGELDTLKPRC